MRTITRSIIGTAVALPLLLVGTGSAFASEDGASTDLGIGVGTTVTANQGIDGDRWDDDNGILGDLIGDVDEDNREDDRDGDDVLGDILGTDEGDDSDSDNDSDRDSDRDVLGDVLG